MSAYGGASVVSSGFASGFVRNFALREIAVVDSPYTVQADDYEIHADTTLGPITVNLPAAATARRRRLVVKNRGTAGNNVTVDPIGAETVDAAPVLLLPDNGSAGLTGPLTGTNWAVT